MKSFNLRKENQSVVMMEIKMFGRVPAAKISFDIEALLLGQKSHDEWDEIFSSLTIDQFLFLGQSAREYLDNLKNLNADNFNGSVFFFSAYARYLMYYAHFDPYLKEEKRIAAIGMAEAMMDTCMIIERHNSFKDRAIGLVDAFSNFKDYCAKFGYKSEVFPAILEMKKNEKIFKE